jgi:transcriptional regulator with XRE-family HTH domain
MKREELLKSKEYWTTKIQLDLFEMIHAYMKVNKLNQTQLAERLGVTKGYVSQLLNGNFDHKVSKLVEMALALGKIPQFAFTDLMDYLEEDKLEVRHERSFLEPAIIRISYKDSEPQGMVKYETTNFHFQYNNPHDFTLN